ncbi:hypothetical protein [Streptomyces sp. NPDC088752]|uniref:hypothetical protein n=1 Tax=Streptomyces sp. NPDC088752 TaxID=3154963 RepID=UPI00344715BE
MQSFNREDGAREIETLLLRGINSAWGEDENVTTVIVNADVHMPTLAESFQVEVKAVAFDEGGRPATLMATLTDTFSRISLQRQGSEIGLALKKALAAERDAKQA